jgi:hypothetical protein
LSAVLAHELNNIAVPLRGFIDLTTGETVTAENARQCLEEVRIGVERIAALAFELESLTSDTSTRSAVRVSDCLAPMETRSTHVPPEVALSCDPELLLTVDVGHARRAISCLSDLAGAARLSITDALSPGAVCAVCGVGPLRPRNFLQVRANDLRPPILSALAAPFDANHKIRSQQRLLIAALRHTTHLAGGHVLADAPTGAVCIALPKT